MTDQLSLKASLCCSFTFVLIECSVSLFCAYALLRFWHKKHLGYKNTRVWLKIPVLVAKITYGDGLTSCEKLPVLVATKRRWKRLQVWLKNIAFDATKMASDIKKYPLA